MPNFVIEKSNLGLLSVSVVSCIHQCNIAEIHHEDHSLTELEIHHEDRTTNYML